MMSIQQYLTQIKTKLLSSYIVQSVTIVKERTTARDGYFRARLTLTNGDFLEVVEYFILQGNFCITETYRYQWMDGSQQVMKKRWDNVKHFPNLPNFPHHVHVGNESNVEPSQLLSIIDLIDLLEQESTDP